MSVGQLVEGVGDGQLFQGIVRLGIGGERLPSLLGPAEVPAQGEVLPQRVSLGVGLPHQDPAQVGMPGEDDAEHVEHLPLQPIGAAPEIDHRAHLERPGLVERDLDPQIGPAGQRAQLVDDLERALRVAILHRGDVREVVVALGRRVLEPGQDVVAPLAARVDDGAAAGGERPADRVAEFRAQSSDRWGEAGSSRGCIRPFAALRVTTRREIGRIIRRIWSGLPSSRTARTARPPARGAGTGRKDRPASPRGGCRR